MFLISFLLVTTNRLLHEDISAGEFANCVPKSSFTISHVPFLRGPRNNIFQLHKHQAVVTGEAKRATDTGSAWKTVTSWRKHKQITWEGHWVSKGLYCWKSWRHTGGQRSPVPRDSEARRRVLACLLLHPQPLRWCANQSWIHMQWILNEWKTH